MRQSRAVWSSLDETRYSPSGLKATWRTLPLWSKGGSTGSRVLASQTRAARSLPPLAMSLPSGLKTAHWAALSCSSGLPLSHPVAASQRRTRRSLPAVSTVLAVGAEVGAFERVAVLQRRRRAAPLAKRPRPRAVLSRLAVSTRSPSGLNQRLHHILVVRQREEPGAAVPIEQMSLVVGAAVATRLPSGLKLPWRTASSWSQSEASLGQPRRVAAMRSRCGDSCSMSPRSLSSA